MATRKPDLNGKWALVTGASSGLGVDFARALAERGMNIVVTARREERLQALKQALETAHTVRVEILTADLGLEDAGLDLYNRIKGMGIHIDVLINNAGSGIWGPFRESDWSRVRRMLQVDVVALTQLTWLFFNDMLDKNQGYILQVASIGAYQPSPMYAAYSAAKAYVLSLGEALAEEARKTNVHVTVVSPGVTRTEFLDTAGQKANWYQRLVMMESRPVVDSGLKALFKGTPGIVTGIGNKLTIFSVRFMPRVLQARVAHFLMK